MQNIRVKWEESTCRSGFRQHEGTVVNSFMIEKTEEWILLVLCNDGNFRSVPAVVVEAEKAR